MNLFDRFSRSVKSSVLIAPENPEMKMNQAVEDIDGAVRSQQNTCDKHNILTLPAGHSGLHFSNTVPCEICRIDEDSPIFSSSLQLIGRVAFQLSIPNKVDIHGALDNETLEVVLKRYHNVPNRKIMFKNRQECSKQGLVTTTVLPEGSINKKASFQSSRGLFASLNRVYVENSWAKETFEYPVGQFVKKVIIPNHIVIENGIRTPKLLLQTLNHFSKIPGRKIVFQKEYPRGGTVTSITLPIGPTGLLFYSDYDDKSSLPIVSTVLVGSSAWKLNVPVDHVVKKLIVPNEITIERMGCVTVEKVLNDYSEVDGRVVVLQEFHRNIPRVGATITITLPTGRLGVVLTSDRGTLWVSKVRANSQLLEKVPVGYYVESLIIPDKLELIGIEELRNAVYIQEKLNESSHVSHRILVLQQDKKDVKKRRFGTRFKSELV